MAFSIRPYARALYEAAAGKTAAEAKQLTESVLDLLAEKGQLRRSPELIAEIERLDDQASGRLRARIRSAHRLDEATLAKIGQMLRKRTGASEIVWEKEVDH